MLNFKLFLKEMPALAQKVPRDDISDKSNRDIKKDIKGLKPISSTSTHDIHRRENMFGEHEYIAQNKKTKDIDMFVTGERSGGAYNISGLLGRKGSTIKAPDFYEHINQHHEPTIFSDRVLSGRINSDNKQIHGGGAGVWKELINRGNTVTHHDDDDKPIKLHTGDDFHKNFSDENESFRFRLRRKD